MINSITPLVISTISAYRAYGETVLITLSVTSTWRITPRLMNLNPVLVGSKTNIVFVILGGYVTLA